MKDLSNYIESNICELIEVRNILIHRLSNAPEGCVSERTKNNRTFYRYSTANEAAGKTIEKYLSKNDTKMIKALMEKAYYKKLLREVEKQLKIHQTMQKNYSFEALFKPYNDMSKDRKKIVEPVFKTDEELKFEEANALVEKWRAKKRQFNTSHPEGLRHETNQGEKRRSKSEAAISNMLDVQPDLEYFYEPCYVIKGRKFCPDFEIINKRTGKVFFWEHFGGMYFDGYIESMTEKINDYTSAGLRLGHELLLTFETEEKPLQPGIIKKIIAQILQ